MKDFISDAEMAKLDSQPKDFISDEEMNQFENSSKNIPMVDNLDKKQTDNPLAALGIGALQGASFGFADEAQGAVGGLERGVNYLRGKTTGDKGFLDAMRTGYITDRDAARFQEQELVKSNPISSFAGQIASGIPSMAAKGAFTIPSMVAQGALSGLGNAQGDVAQQATGAAIGGGIAGGLGVAANKAAPLVSKGVNDLKTRLGLLGLGSSKPAVRQMGENTTDVVQAAINNGAMNPLKSIAGQQRANEKVLQSSGQALGNVREKLPSVPTQNILDAIKNRSSKLEAGLDDSALNQITKLQEVVKNRSTEGTSSIADIVGLKGKIGESSRTAFGDITKNKEGMDIVRSALRDVEVDSASKLAPEYRKFLKDSSTAHTVAKLLQEKEVAKNVNSMISLGGMIGGAGYAAGNQDPKGLLVAALFSKTGRDKLAQLGAVSIDAVQKLATKLKIDPKVVAYLLSRQNSGEK